MVDENLTDEQQADLIRKWIRENGLFIVGGLGIGVGSLFGWDQWQSYQTGHAEEASGLYEELVDKIQVNNQDVADSLLAELVVGYAGSPYIDQARLRLAKMSLDRSDFDAAASHLELLAAQSDNSELVHIASIRLARIRLQQEQYDAALAVLEQTNPDSAFNAKVNDVRGDIYVAMGHAGKALAAYDAALTDTRQPPTIDRAYVQTKRDGLTVNDLDLEVDMGIDMLDGAEDAGE